MVEVRCKGCGKLLGKFDGTGDIKCPRTSCGGRNIFDTKKKSIRFVPNNFDPLKDRVTSSGVTFRWK